MDFSEPWVTACIRMYDQRACLARGKNKGALSGPLAVKSQRAYLVLGATLTAGALAVL